MTAATLGKSVAVAGVVLTAGAVHLLRNRSNANEVTTEYVAMGSSFAAGPGDGHRAAGALSLCYQSDSNYPHLLARRYGLSLKDVTCSGATSVDVLKGGQWFLPAQVNAIHPGTKLVTITIGGNDVFYLGSMTAWACADAPSQVPWLVRALGMCRAPDDRKVERAFQLLPGQLSDIVAEIHRRAPKAHVLFIDYTTVLPSSGTCARLPLKSWQADKARGIANRLNAETAEVARETNSQLVRASDLTQAHDVCSSDPWVHGFEFPATPLAFGPVPFHPTQQAMEAIANAAGRQLAPLLR